MDSTPKSTDKALERLLKLGFKKEQVAVHTANEPDADILALADDEEREVLVFKMSVALGFDAPRAFVLCSMRAARDEDFGVQLVGRILRVHRTLQTEAAKGKLPDDLRYGYVFLADPTAQTGIDLAGQRINRIQTEYAKVSQKTTVVKTPDGVLLAEPKFHFERRDEIPKADVAHASYGKVLVLHREGGVEWRVVQLDAKRERPSLGDKLRIADFAGWGR